MELMSKVLAFASVIISVVHTTEVLVTTNVGQIRGIKTEETFNGRIFSVNRFLGVPYAESTAGDARFKKPMKKAPFTDVFNATTEAPSCVANNNIFPTNAEQSEDCLTLNIIIPDTALTDKRFPRAVMVWIYGGGFQAGAQNEYLAPALVGLNDVIFVSMNYRISLYGFLGSKKHGIEGNFGLWDQHMAIQWVHDNIQAFGGDKAKVTIFGESAGSAAVFYQTLYPGNQGLFQRAIAESGGIGGYWSYTSDPDAAFEHIASEVGCHDDLVACLRSKTNEDFQKALSMQTFFSPIQDGEFVTFDPAQMITDDTFSSGVFNDIDFIIGMNNNEGLMSLYMLALLSNRSMEEFSSGISEEDFLSFIPQTLNLNRLPDDEALVRAITHEYTDWTDPSNPISRRDGYLQQAMDMDFTTTITQRLYARSRSSRATYAYVFEQRPFFSMMPTWAEGASHADEIGFVLGFPANSYGVDSEGAPADQIKLAEDMMLYWTFFAKTG